VAFVSPPRNHVVGITNSTIVTNNIINFFEDINSSSYVVFDSGYKYVYDRYNDVYRYVPLNGDMAGLAARTDLVADAWFSPAGFNRGQVRGVVKLAYNPTKSQRDQLYPKRVNPVTFFPGQGTVLFGDKTVLLRESAFDRINVRRLLLQARKLISAVSVRLLFEQNDAQVRQDFLNAVNPILDSIRRDRGLYDFRVTVSSDPEDIDRNQMTGKIYIKPTRSLEFIDITFYITPTGASFENI